MPDLFGLDIAGVLNDAMGSDLLQGQLRKKAREARAPGNLTGGTAGAFGDPVDFNGFIEERSEENRGNTLTRLGGKVVSVLGGSLPAGTIPERGDSLAIEGETYVIKKTTRDPAGAMYECQVEEK